MNKRTFIKNLSLAGLASLMPDIAFAPPSLENIPNMEVMYKWRKILDYNDGTLNRLCSLKWNDSLIKEENDIFYIPKEQVYECVNEMETLETKCKALQKINPALDRKITRVLHLGIPSIRGRFGRKSNAEEYPLILFKEVNEKGILVNLENSKRDNLFISWNARIFDEDITSWTAVPYDTVFVVYINDEQYRLTLVNKDV